MDCNHPFITHVIETGKKCTRKVVLAQNSLGTGWTGSKAHAPNESIRMKDFEDNVVHLAYMLIEFPTPLEQ